jgi:hypothetical protein
MPKQSRAVNSCSSERDCLGALRAPGNFYFFSPASRATLSQRAISLVI